MVLQSRSDRKVGKPKKKMKTWLKVVLSIFGALIILVAGLGAYAYIKTDSILKNSYKSANIKKMRDTNALLSAKKPISILLLGTDTGELDRTYKGRTDSMIVATINPKNNKTTLVSIPRDTYIQNIPGYPQYSPAKINAAYAYGSAGTSIKTVQNLLDIPIDYYALINMGGLEKLIDEVGSVTVSSPLTFDYEGYSFTAGQAYNMDGKEALAFSRMRYDDPRGDYGRQDRQRLVIAALLKKLATPANVTNTKLMTALAKNVQTDITFGDMQKFAIGYRSAAHTIVSDHVEGTGQMIDGQSYQIISKTEIKRVHTEISNQLK
ncbi:MAG: LCP family protein [Lactobacillaceae bacterium]|jgi:LCP family protein required for cell wall assembly|nr:LCP family protein [Lactobacillaceae bacterium]